MAATAQRWRTLAALLKNPSVIPSTQVVTHDHLQLHFQDIWCPLLASSSTRHAEGTYTVTCSPNTHTQKVQNIKNMHSTTWLGNNAGKIYHKCPTVDDGLWNCWCIHNQTMYLLNLYLLIKCFVGKLHVMSDKAGWPIKWFYFYGPVHLLTFWSTSRDCISGSDPVRLDWLVTSYACKFV